MMETLIASSGGTDLPSLSVTLGAVARAAAGSFEIAHRVRSKMSVADKMKSDGEPDYRLLLDSVTDTEIIMLDNEGIVRTWNRGAEMLTGYRADEIVGKPMSIFYTEEDRSSGLAQRELRVADDQGRFELEGWRVGKGGRRFWANVVLQPMRDDRGRLTGYVKTARDVTVKRERELELRTASLMLNSMTDYEVILLDANGVVRTWNKGAESLKGYQAHEVIGKHVSIFYPEEDVRADLASRELDTANRTGRFEFEGWRVRKDGTRFWANVILTPVRDDAGEHIGFVKVARDLSERIERQRLLEKQRDEILELSTPVIQVWDRILALPVVGTLDSQRAAHLTENLLQKIASDEAEFVIIDISGVPMIDTQVAQHLLKTVQGARLMGSESIISGVRPETAQAMVHLGIDIGTLRSRATLRDALQLALRLRKERAENLKGLEL
jgi:rsbT co-antagonist protein RsbR